MKRISLVIMLLISNPAYAKCDGFLCGHVEEAERRVEATRKQAEDRERAYEEEEHERVIERRHQEIIDAIEDIDE